MPPSASSRIPTRTTRSSASTTPNPGPSSKPDENRAPRVSSKPRSFLAVPKPVSTSSGTAAAASNHGSQRNLRDRSNTPQDATVEISVQLPSSEPVRRTAGRAIEAPEHPEEDTDDEAEPQNEEAAKPSSLLPVPAVRRRSLRSKSRSKSPQIIPPSKPTYATLTSRRRSAAALRRQSSAALVNPSTIADDAPTPADVSTSAGEPTAQATTRRSSLRPRPSEIIPLAAPEAEKVEAPKVTEAEDEGEEEDELMLLPPERGRGKGEGKEGVRRRWEREREASRRSRSQSETLALPTKGEEEEAAENEEFDWGGFDAGAEDVQGELQTAASEGEQEVDDEDETTPQNVTYPIESDRNAAISNSEEAMGRDTEAIRRRSDTDLVEDNHEYDAEQDLGPDSGEEEDRKDFLPLQDQDESDGEPEDEDLPYVDQPRYTLPRSPTSSQRDGTPPPALQEGQSYSQIFPPLSPNTTGEYDEVEPIRDSTEPPEAVPVSEEQPNREEFSPSEEQARGSVLPSPFLKREEPTTMGRQHLEVLSAKFPTREVTPQSPAYLQFEKEALSAPTSSFLSPSSFLARTFSRTRSLTPAEASPSSRQIPQLNFVALPSPRRLQLPPRSPSATALEIPALKRARRPSPLAHDVSGAVETAPAQQEWTRGPAFFRSSSFTPPPVRSSFDRKGKAKAINQDKPGYDEEEEEESREYWRPGAMTGTSPHVSERGQTAESEGLYSQVEERRSAVSIGTRQTGSPSPAADGSKFEAGPPPTPPKDRPSPTFGNHNSDDASMRSPVASLRSRHSSASPPRSPNGDFVMSSPAASLRSIEMAFSPHSPSKKLPATPPPPESGGVQQDRAMLSPSPAGRASQLRRSPSKLEELVEAGKEKLTGLLSFGASRVVGPSVPSSQTESLVVPAASSQIPVPHETDADRATAKEHRREEQEEAEEDERDEQDVPFPLSSTQTFDVHAPRQADESIFSNFPSFADTTSASTSTRRRRSSHYSKSGTSHAAGRTPVIEISSTDAKAAARAAAILKVYHKYVEQGIEGSLARDEASRVIREAEKRGQAAIDDDDDDDERVEREEEDASDEEEEELRTLLLDAEEEVRETFGRGLSVATSMGSSSRSLTPRERGQTGDRDDPEQEEEEVRSVLLSKSPSPSTISRQPIVQTSTTVSRERDRVRSRSSSGGSASGLTSIVGERWSSREWRRLEQSLVELKRRLKAEGQVRDVEAVEVVEAFLNKWDIQKEECQGDWEWDKLLIRVQAIKARRAKDVREHRATSQVSALSVSSSSMQSQTSSNIAEEGSAGGAEGDRTIIKEEEKEDVEHCLASDHGSDSHDSSAGDSEGDDGVDEETRDDTFFATNRRLRKTRRASMPHTRLPTALSNPRLAHIYDDAPAPEKPRLPIKEMLERSRSTEPLEAQAEEEDESTPEPQPAPASSAQRLFSYLGSFVRRSPGPSPSSSKFAPSSSVSPSPEPVEEMSESRLGPSPGVYTPKAVSLSDSRTRSSHSENREILPLPHVHHHQQEQAKVPRATARTPAVSNAPVRARLAVPSTGVTNASRSIRRRRSSGEEGKVWEAVNAIEEAESSREEEEARIVELLRSGSAKRKASAGDLRRKVQRGEASRKI